MALAGWASGLAVALDRAAADATKATVKQSGIILRILILLIVLLGLLIPQ
jgi:hypothetical protein